MTDTSFVSSEGDSSNIFEDVQVPVITKQRANPLFPSSRGLPGLVILFCLFLFIGELSPDEARAAEGTCAIPEKYRVQRDEPNVTNQQRENNKWGEWRNEVVKRTEAFSLTGVHALCADKAF